MKAIALTIALISALLVGMALEIFPMPMMDAMTYVPVAIHLKNGWGMTNPFAPGAVLDPTGQSNFIYYPPLFPWAVAKLMVSHQPNAAFVAIAFIRVFTLILSAIWLRRTGAGTLMICLALLSLSSNWMPSEGRPEALATFFALIGAVTAISGRANWKRMLGVGISLGLLGATHPIGGLMAIPLAGMYFSSRFSWKQAWGRLASIGCAASGTFLIAMQAAPAKTTEVLAAMMKLSNTIIFHGAPGFDPRYWLLAGRTPFLGVILIVFSFLACIVFITQLNYIKSLKSFLLFAFGFSVAVYYFALRMAATNYNLLLFSPFLYAIPLHWLAKTRARRPLQWAVLLCVALPSLGLMRYSYFFFTLKNQRVTWNEASRAYEEITAKYPDLPAQIWHPNYLWPLVTHYTKIPPQIPASPPSLLMVSQLNFEKDAPPEIPGYTRIKTLLSPMKKESFSPFTPAWNTGFGFAAYVPESRAKP